MKTNRELKSGELYCPVCQQVLIASNVIEVERGEHNGYVFVHEDIPHDDENMAAISAGIN